MSNWGIEDNNDGQPNNDNTGGGLRQFAEAVKAENKKLKDDLAAIQQQLRENAIGATLRELQVPDTVATQYQGEADPAKVREWVETMRSAFGSSNGQGTAQTPIGQPQQTIDPSVAAQLQQMNNAGAEGTPLGNAEAALGKVNDANSVKDLLAAWTNMPG